MVVEVSVPEDGSAHYPVMLPEVLSALDPKDGGVYVDGTFGAGGYSKAILDAADCSVYAIDRDPSAVKRAEEIKQEYGDRFTFMQGRFGHVEGLLEANGVAKIDGFVLDVGVSSMQIDEAERGFSFRYDGPLDMRMDNESGSLTAADIVNDYEEGNLANIIYEYGQERMSRRIAKAIVARRSERKFERTQDLADVIRGCVPKKPRDKIDPATRTFQALRIAVNDELRELSRALSSSEKVLGEGGRLVVVSFHSLEDGLVKRFLKEKSGGDPKVSRYLPQSVKQADAVFVLPNRNKAVKPSDEEVGVNSRSRSARLRCGVRTSAPASYEGGAQ